MPDVRRELRDVCQLTLLTGGPGLGDLSHAVCEGLVISEHHKVPSLEGKPKTADGKVDSQKFLVEGTVSGFRRPKLATEEA
jgi:hypothetical protein